MERVLSRLGDVTIVAPAVEQSGVGHSITFLAPLMAAEAFDGERRRGWAVEGSPADCVKLAIGRFCPQRPDLIVSGINGGFNIGINVLYSGTVAGATEGALFGIPSVAVSLEYDERPKFDRAATLAVGLIRQIIAQQDARSGPLYQYQYPRGGAGATDRGPRGTDGHGTMARRLRRADRPQGTALLLGDGDAADRRRGRVNGPRSDRPRIRDAHAAADRSYGTESAGTHAGLEAFARCGGAKLNHGACTDWSDQRRV